jgi:hypothetical protein
MEYAPPPPPYDCAAPLEPPALPPMHSTVLLALFQLLGTVHDVPAVRKILNCFCLNIGIGVNISAS